MTKTKDTTLRVFTAIAVAVAYFIVMLAVYSVLTAVPPESQFSAGQLSMLANFVIVLGASWLYGLLVAPLNRIKREREEAERKARLIALFAELGTNVEKYEAERREFLAGHYGNG